MNHIGGFFELEPEDRSTHAGFHDGALALHTGRACLMVILAELSPRRVFVPHYTCDATLAPFRTRGIATEYYAIDSTLLPTGIPVLRDGDYVLYTNYFGLCEEQVERLLSRCGERLLVDDTHAFFRGRRPGVWSFTSARKYFGVPDGAYLYAPQPLSARPSAFSAITLDHLRLRQQGRQAEAFAAFQRYECSLDCRVFGISAFSHERLSHVNYAAVAEARRRNFQLLHHALAATNRLNLDLGDCVPFCYPYLPRVRIEHQRLYDHHIYPPKLWVDVLKRNAPAWEQELAEALLPLPIDHRYGSDTMQTMLNVLDAL